VPWRTSFGRSWRFLELRKTITDTQYIDVTPPSRFVWTNAEGREGGAVTTVTFEDRGAETVVVMRDRYPSKEALDDAMASGSTSGFNEPFGQLDDLLVTLA
jgi:uncharacterized protein YndB with AHSA1/START domain